MRLLLLGVSVAIAAASVTSSLTASAAVTTCSGLGAVSGAAHITYGTCTTDLNGGDGSTAFSGDGQSLTLSARSKRGDEQVAGFWGSDGPISVAVTTICLGLNVTDLKLKGDAAVEEQLILTYDGVTHAPLTWSVTTTGLQPAYCGSVPRGATNVWWQLISTAGASKPFGQARVSQTLVTVGYSG